VGRVVNWFIGVFFAAAGTILLITLQFFGWLKWLMSSLFIFGSVVLGWIGFTIAFRPDKFFNRAFESVPSTKKRAVMSILCFSGMIFIIALSVLIVLDIISVGGD
jgi:uncharacterized BrkB/YihY/UPF0761 family membrane protein